MNKPLALFMLFLAFSCHKKPSYITYKVSSIGNPGTYACVFKAKADKPNNPEISFYAECKKYKIGDVAFRILE